MELSEVKARPGSPPCYDAMTAASLSSLGKPQHLANKSYGVPIRTTPSPGWTGLGASNSQLMEGCHALGHALGKCSVCVCSGLAG